MASRLSRLAANLGALIVLVSFVLLPALPALAQTPPPTPRPTTPAPAPPSTPPTTPGYSPTPGTEAVSGGETVEVPFRPINPRPIVPIPGVTFSSAREVGGSIQIPFLAQYISGIYRLSVGLGAILAAIMIVYGGFRYMLAASLPDVKDGKTIIQDAFIGLVVLLSSFLILKTINPALVSPAVITVDRIDRQNPITVAEQFMMTVAGPTSGPEFERGTAPTLRDCPFTDLPPGHVRCGRTPEDPCPPGHCEALGRPRGCQDSAIETRDRATDARYNAFVQRIQANMASVQNPQQRVVQAGIAAAHCNIHMGSCGTTAAALRQIANAPARTDHVFSNTDLVRSVRPIRCPKPEDAARCPEKPGCSATRPEAMQRVRDMVRAEQDARAQLLQPGDWFWVYNANTQECATGLHSAVFISWNGPRARVVQGQNGDYVWEGSVCLLTSCPGGNFTPILKVH